MVTGRVVVVFIVMVVMIRVMMVVDDKGSNKGDYEHNDEL